MSDINKGVLIYNEWFESMRRLRPTDFKKLVLGIYEFQIHDTPPPEFEGVACAIASIIFPYIERRKVQSEKGRVGANIRYSRGLEPFEDDSAISTPNSTPISHNEIKSNKTKLTYNKTNPNQPAYPSAAGGMGSARGYATYKKEKETDKPRSFDTDEFFEAAIARTFRDILSDAPTLPESQS